jgi:NADPH:quinone reductase-like Zn-dependent oxidoreductase
LSGFLESGQLAPVVDRTFPLAEVPDAMRRLEAGSARGKIAVTT